MGSQLPSIISAIAALPITVSGTVVPVRFGSALRDSAELPDIPLRILAAPTRATGGKTKVTTLGGAGHLLDLEWMITDVSLLRYVGTGLGLQDIGQVYIDAYCSIVDTARMISSSTYSLQRIDLLNGVTEYPQGSGAQYHSITTIYTIREIVQ